MTESKYSLDLIIWYRVLDGPVFDWSQTLFADGSHHKKSHIPAHPKQTP